MAQRKAADVLVETLQDWGVEVVFGLPGDGINGIMEALRTRRDQIRFIQVRHEEAAAFMACGYAKFTGKLGVCLATSGPGGIHLLNGLYDAKMDGQPVLAITGHHYHDTIDTFAQQDVDLDRVFQDVAVYSTRVMGKNHVEPVTNLACRMALTRRGVAHINFPIDLQEEETDKPSKHGVPGHSSAAWARRVSVPSADDLARAASVLSAGKKVAILAGRGALGATDELERVADALAAPIVKALLGKAAVPDDSPFTTGQIGPIGTRPSQDAFEQCDTLLVVGSSFPYMEFLPKPGQARGVQIDSDPTRIGLRYPVEVGLAGDARESLLALLPLIERRQDRSFLEQAQQGMREWREVLDERATCRDRPMKPQVVAYELGRRLGENAILACDSGTVAGWWARHIPARRGQMHSVSGTLASMGCGLPYAIAAQIAYPDRQVVAFVGDGALSMVMAEFATCVKYELPVKVVVCKNNSLGMIRWEQMMYLGNPEFGCELQPIDFVKVAEACGGTGLRADDPSTCGTVLDDAMRWPGPVIVEAVVDPDELITPAKMTEDERKNLERALSRGQAGAERIERVVSARVKQMI